jgi:hypothetical protein
VTYKICRALSVQKWYKWSSFPQDRLKVPQVPGLYFLRWNPETWNGWCSLKLRIIKPPSGLPKEESIAASKGIDKAQRKLQCLCQIKLNNSCPLLYIGKAGPGKKKKRGLQKRIWEFYGSSLVFCQHPLWIVLPGAPGFSHGGGKSVWLLEDVYENVEYTWVEIKNIVKVFSGVNKISGNPSDDKWLESVEHQLISESTVPFSGCGGTHSFPFGNNIGHL